MYCFCAVSTSLHGTPLGELTEIQNRDKIHPYHTCSKQTFFFIEIILNALYKSERVIKCTILALFCMKVTNHKQYWLHAPLSQCDVLYKKKVIFTCTCTWKCFAVWQSCTGMLNCTVAAVLASCLKSRDSVTGVTDTHITCTCTV